MLGNENRIAATSSSTVGSDDKSKRRRHRRPRATLSCAECRHKKLSCDRQLPCQRCVRSGRPELCSFASGAKPSVVSPETKPAATPATSSNTDLSDQIWELRFEIARLKSQLATSSSVNGRRDHAHDVAAQSVGFAVPEIRLDPDTVESAQTLLPDIHPGPSQVLGLGLTHSHIPDAQQHDLKEPSSRPAHGYYRQHRLFRFFGEVSPYILGWHLAPLKAD
jgi:hypothetical protein